MINNKYNSNNNLASYNTLWNFPSKKTKIHNWKKSPPFIAKLKNVINQKKTLLLLLLLWLWLWLRLWISLWLSLWFLVMVMFDFLA